MCLMFPLQETCLREISESGWGPRDLASRCHLTSPDCGEVGGNVADVVLIALGFSDESWNSRPALSTALVQLTYKHWLICRQFI